MKNRIIALLLWIIIWTTFWVLSEYEKKNKIDSENIKIQTRIQNIEYNNKQRKIKKIKEDILSQMNSDKWTYNLNNELNIKIEIYNYINEYKKIYDIVVNDEDIDDSIWYKEFQNTILYKRLNELKESTLHTKVIYNDWKEINYEYIPIDMACLDNFFCKKIINKELNEVYQLEKNILEIKNKKEIDINKKIVIDILMSNKTLHEYFINKE